MIRPDAEQPTDPAETAGTRRLTIKLIPPDWPGSAPRYQVWDPEHDRHAGVIYWQPWHSTRAPHWRWKITVLQLPGPRHIRGGEEATLEEAKAAFREAWNTYPADPRWPPAMSRAWGNKPRPY